VNISNPSEMVDFIIFIKLGESKMTIQEIVEKLNRSNKDKKVIFYNRTDDGLKEIEFYYSSELGNNTNIVFEEITDE
jgi:hypothetical protein